MRICLAPLAASVLLAATPDSARQPAAPADPLAAMQESIGRQRLSVQKQVQAPGGSSFFILPPPAPVSARAGSADCDPLPEAVLNPLIQESATREKLSPDLLRNVIRQESGGKACAISAKGAQGLMQLMPATSRQFGVGDAFDPRQNIAAGAKYLKQLLDKYSGDTAKALAAYNAGPERVDQAGAVPSIPETINYVSSIMALLPH